ncbi:hypothetical protein Ddye_003334 [Dipteronia dyeriana]|uniref:Reverse transcriptase n=1 Tax=Dipteronia dyeriana TaxID=168575 RepID=A0AAD9XSU0_9ROSI|nr:hypothetical protein Ddye_003334 [Dipteronia dyeriana]
MNQVIDRVQPRLSPCKTTILDRPFSTEEVRIAAFSISPNKTLGQDGMSGTFYQKCWDIIEPKALISRLRVVLDDVISESQNAFIPVRLITDNALIGFECLHAIRNRKRKMGSFALKLDMMKAYDRVELAFMDKMMCKMGFSGQWVAKMMNCVSNVSFSFVIKREVRGLVKPSRGFRQGDHLSPFLFLLCAEGLSSLINSAVINNSLSGFYCIWHRNVPSKIKVFMWLACHQWLPTFHSLAKRGVPSNGIYPRCFHRPETVIHALLGCWIIAKAAHIIYRPKAKKGSTVTKWQPSDEGAWKINIDAATWYNKRIVGLGIMIRDKDGMDKVTASLKLQAMYDLLVAEALAIWKEMQLVVDSGLVPFLVESDSLQAIKLINSRTCSHADIGSIISMIITLLEKFPSCGVIHISRSGNSVAHKLAKLVVPNESNRYWMDSCPHCVERLVQWDRHISTSTISGDKQLLLGSIMRSLVLKACSEDTVDTIITSTSRAKCDRTGYLFTKNVFSLEPKSTIGVKFGLRDEWVQAGSRWCNEGWVSSVLVQQVSGEALPVVKWRGVWVQSLVR